MPILAVASALAIAVCPAPPAPRHTCVHDGDTFWLDGEKIRIAAIDTPELNSRNAVQRQRAIRARDRLVSLINRREITIERIGQDCYGRTLAFVLVDGRQLGDQLVAEGLARRWTGELIPKCRSARRS